MHIMSNHLCGTRQTLLAVACLLGIAAGVWSSEQDSGAGRQPDEQPAVGAMDFDYFVNNWNVVGLKDYLHGTRITPDNRLLLANNTYVQIRLGKDRMPLSRENPKRALHGWMPIIVVTAADGPVHYEITFWATTLPDVKDWQ